MRVIDNKEKRRFETEVDGRLAFIEYTAMPNIVSLNYIEVDKVLEGNGVASEMAEKVLLQIEQRGLKIIPVCPFIKKYIKKHPEWETIVADEQ
jgi:predicted GNAT family acetyltransferase